MYAFWKISPAVQFQLETENCLHFFILGGLPKVEGERFNHLTFGVDGNGLCNNERNTLLHRDKHKAN